MNESNRRCHPLPVVAFLGKAVFQNPVAAAASGQTSQVNQPFSRRKKATPPVTARATEPWIPATPTITASRDLRLARADISSALDEENGRDVAKRQWRQNELGAGGVKDSRVVKAGLWPVVFAVVAALRGAGRGRTNKTPPAAFRSRPSSFCRTARRAVFLLLPSGF